MFFELLNRLRSALILRVAAALILFLIVVLVLIFQDKISAFLRLSNKTAPAAPDVILPKILNSLNNSNSNGLSLVSRLGVVSANIVAVLDKDNKLTGIRILGEVINSGQKYILELSPIVRFFDKDGKSVGQKVGALSSGFNFFGVAPNDKTYYDITVSDPPASDRLEIILNAASASDSAIFEPLKIASRSMAVKTATYQGEASESAGQKVEYYTVSGAAVNPFSNPVTDITIYAWVKNLEGKVFSFARQDFKNDLIPTGEKLDFHLNLLPLKNNEKYDSYEVSAWGKEYKLNL